MNLLNIFEWCRNDRGFDGEPIADSLPKLEGLVTEDELHPDGTVYRTKYLLERAGALLEVAHDYRRPDGSVFLRTPAGAAAESTPTTPYIVVNGQGQPTQSSPRKGAWHQLWLRTLAGDAERVFVISDSRFALAHVTPMRRPAVPHPAPDAQHPHRRETTVGLPALPRLRTSAEGHPEDRRAGDADPSPA